MKKLFLTILLLTIMPVIGYSHTGKAGTKDRSPEVGSTQTVLGPSREIKERARPPRRLPKYVPKTSRK
jgi:hypothetical protein